MQAGSWCSDPAPTHRITHVSPPGLENTPGKSTDSDLKRLNKQVEGRVRTPSRNELSPHRLFRPPRPSPVHTDVHKCHKEASHPFPIRHDRHDIAAWIQHLPPVTNRVTPSPGIRQIISSVTFEGIWNWRKIVVKIIVA